MPLSDIIADGEFQSLKTDEQVWVLNDLIARDAVLGKDFGGLAAEQQRSLVDDLLRQHKPKGMLESVVGALPVVGPLASQFVYNRPPAESGLVQDAPTMPTLTGEEKPRSEAEIAVGQAMMDGVLLYGSMGVANLLGFTGRTISSILGREAVEGGIYGVGQLAVTPPASLEEAGQRVAIESAGGAVGGAVLRGVVSGGGRLLNTQGSIRRSLEKEFGSPEIYSDFAKRTSQALETNNTSLVTEMEVDSALRAIEHRRGGAARDMREFLGEFKKAQAEQVLNAPQPTRPTGPFVEDIYPPRGYDLPTGTEEERVAAAKDFMSERIAARQERAKAQFAEDAAVRQHAGLPVGVSDDGLKSIDAPDYRVKAEQTLRQIERDAVRQSLAPTQTFMRRLDAATTLAEGRGAAPEATMQLRQIVFAGKDRVIASADNLPFAEAQAIAQDLRVAGLRSVQLSPEPGGKVFSVAATVGESSKEVQLRGAFDTYIKNKGVFDPVNNTYAGLSVAEHRALGEAFGAPEAQITRFERLTTETLEQAQRLNLRAPISAENLGVPLIEEQVVGSARSAATIRTDVGSLLPAPRPFLVGEPITARLGDEEISGVVDAVALDASGRQAIVITTAEGQTARIPDEASIQHVFELTKPAAMPQPTGDAVLRTMHSLDPSMPVAPPIRVRPGEISKAIDALRTAKVNASAKLRSNGDVDLDIGGVVKGRFNPREAEQIVENLLRSKAAQMEWQNRIGGKECL